MQLASVNLGQVKTIAHGKKRFATRICKRPVTAPVVLGEMGARDDAIADLEHMAVWIRRSTRTALTTMTGGAY